MIRFGKTVWYFWHFWIYFWQFVLRKCQKYSELTGCLVPGVENLDKLCNGWSIIASWTGDRECIDGDTFQEYWSR